jgi:hypothetical protein
VWDGWEKNQSNRERSKGLERDETSASENGKVRGCHGGDGGEEERGKNEEGAREESVEVHFLTLFEAVGWLVRRNGAWIWSSWLKRSICCWFVVVLVKGGRGCVERERELYGCGSVEGESYSSCVER